MSLGVNPHRLPLRWRLVVAALFGAVCFAIGFGVFSSWEIDHLEDRGLASALQARLELARDNVQPDGRISGDEPSPRTSLVQTLDASGAIVAATPALAGQPPLVNIAKLRQTKSGRLVHSLELRHTRLTVLAVPLRLDRGGHVSTGALVVGLDSEGFLAAANQLDAILAIGLGVIVPLAGVLAWLLAGRALRTVTVLTEEAEAVGVSDLGRGLVVPASDPELSRLVAALNRMLSRLADAVEHERRFAADASHRLRTPLATLRAEAELALAEGHTEGMREALAHVIADADNLTDLVNRLLAAHRRNPADLRPVAAACNEAVERWRRQVQAAGLDFAESYAEPVATANGSDNGAVLDPHALRSVVDPLVENATQHTPAGGRVGVQLCHQDDRLVVDVCDTGTGVAPEMKERLFRAWSTTRGDRGGAGLGLWLARESARASGGDVVLVDDRPGGTRFRATLPLH